MLAQYGKHCTANKKYMNGWADLKAGGQNLKNEQDDFQVH
jgi:hypothetical protein